MNTGSAAKRQLSHTLVKHIPWSKAIEEETTGHELAEGEAVVGTAELRRMHEAKERM